MLSVCNAMDCWNLKTHSDPMNEGYFAAGIFFSVLAYRLSLSSMLELKQSGEKNLMEL